jgi:glucose-1-phosphate cytidylyltransferase
MKVVILAGGFGTRLSEETDVRPKPLVEIGGRPILWHIMKLYASAGLTDFVICCGYKGSMIKKYFADYYLQTSDIVVDLGRNAIEYLRSGTEDWRVTLVDTGQDTMTGGRLKRVAPYLGGTTFCMTYGDGVCDIDIRKIVEFHRRNDKLATVTAVPSPGRFGILDINATDRVERFHEKPSNEMGWINGGFFVLEPKVMSYIEGDPTIWERQPLEKLASDGQLGAFRHEGFWKAMDTLRDKRELEDLWASGNAPWKRW